MALMRHFMHRMQLRAIRFDVHIGKGGEGGKDRGGGGNGMLVSDTRQQGGSKEDACHLLALLLFRHTSHCTLISIMKR